MTSAQEGSAVKYVVLTHRRMAFHLLLLIWEVSFPDTLPQKRTWYPRLINIDVGFLVFCGCYRSWGTLGKSHTGPARNLCGEGRLVGRGGRGKQPLTQKTTLSCPAPFLPVSSFPLPLPPPLFPPPFASTSGFHLFTQRRRFSAVPSPCPHAMFLGSAGMAFTPY